MLKQYDFKELWSSWIPTNLGKLQNEFIGNYDSLSDTFSAKYIKRHVVDSTFSTQQVVEISDMKISDTACLVTTIFNFIFYEQIAPEGKITFDKLLDSNVLIGLVQIKYPNKKTNLETCISTNFKLFQNGAVFLNNISIKYNDSETDIALVKNHEREIANALYNFLKRVVHGDNHHHAKIDTLVYVHQVPNNPDFSTLGEMDICFTDIQEHMSKKIKVKEREIKSNKQDNCDTWLKKIDVYHSLKGYFAYYKTFKNLFIDDKGNKDSLENVLESAEVISDKIELIVANRKSYVTHVFALISIFIAIIVLSNNIINHPVSNISNDLKTVIPLSLVAIYAFIALMVGYYFILRPFFCGVSIKNTKPSCLLETIRQAHGNILSASIIIFLLLCIIFVLSYSVAKIIEYYLLKW
ncbi:MAG: hypothetical protein WC665_11705 [Sulfurimonas sp.]|jgi:hypothetical protein